MFDKRNLSFTFSLVFFLSVVCFQTHLLYIGKKDYFFVEGWALCVSISWTSLLT